MNEQDTKQPGVIGPGPWAAGIGLGAVLVALTVAAYNVGLNEGEERATERAATAPAAEQKPARKADAEPASAPAPDPAAAKGPGKKLFAAKCGSCHTLEAAGTEGTMGPNLDDLKPDIERTLRALANGGTGSNTMPRNLYTGKQAQQVAEFLAAAAGG